jgi:hypothetical protein
MNIPNKISRKTIFEPLNLIFAKIKPLTDPIIHDNKVAGITNKKLFFKLGPSF